MSQNLSVKGLSRTLLGDDRTLKMEDIVTERQLGPGECALGGDIGSLISLLDALKWTASSVPHYSPP